MSTLLIIQLIVSWLLIIAVIIPMIKNDYWIFKILEYPRGQKFLLLAFVFITLAINNDYGNDFAIITMVVLGIGMVYLSVKIWPYTPFFKKEMLKVPGSYKENQVKLLTANVLQDNRDYDKMLQQVKQKDPDVILLLETDKGWAKAMEVLKKNYPYYLEEPLDNYYGLVFYSRLKMKEGEVKYIVEDNIPSVEVLLELPSGQPFKLWGLHPKPPVPGEDDRSTAKDKELMKVAFRCEKEQLPMIVLGDLNDVAWSHVTELFRKTSGLLDPRRGRGFYSTFSANHWYMRFPLDYVFCSSHFGLVNMKRLKHNGSDHFPMYMHLEFQPSLEGEQEKPHADKEEREEAAETANQQVEK